jgi:DNA replication protein DnaC
MTSPAGKVLLAAFAVCPACIEAAATQKREDLERQDQEARAKYAAKVAEEAATVRADPVKALAAAGVPRALEGACLASIRLAGDVPVEIVDSAEVWIAYPAGFLTLTGPPGSGKSYLAAAMLRSGLEAGLVQGCNCRFLSEYDYLSTITLDYGVPARHVIYDRIPFLVYDDLGAGYANDLRKSALGELFRARWNAELPTIVTTNLTIGQISSIDARIASVMAAGQNVLVLHANDLRRKGKLASGHE